MRRIEIAERGDSTRRVGAFPPAKFPVDKKNRS
jgi:hypothetical protein